MIGERLRIARRKSGLSLRDLADRMGGQITHAAIGKYERGRLRALHELKNKLEGKGGKGNG